MSGASYSDALSLSDLPYPVSYLWITQGPWGRTQTEVTVDVPALAGDPEAVVRLGGLLWDRTIAGAITGDTRLQTWFTMRWKGSPVAEPSLEPGGFGKLSGVPAPQNRSAVLVMTNTHGQSPWARRIFLPGVPARWIESGMVTAVGRRALEGTAQQMVMGLCGHLVGGPLGWLARVKSVEGPTFDNPHGVAFRRVEVVAVAQYADRAPSFSQAPWP